MQEEGEQLWRLENQLYHGSLIDQLKALNKLGYLLKQNAQNQFMVLQILAKSFQHSSDILLKQQIVYHIQTYMPYFFDKIEDWSRIIKQFTSDIYSNYYKLRITSLQAIKAISPILKYEYDVYHLTYDLLIKSKIEIEISVAFDTLKQLSFSCFDQSFMKKFQTFSLNEIQFFKFRKLYMILSILEKNPYVGQYSKSILVNLMKIHDILLQSLDQNDSDIVKALLNFLSILYLTDCVIFIQKYLDEIFFNPRIISILKEQEPSFIQSYQLVSLRILYKLCKPEIFTINLKTKMINHIHSIRDLVRGFSNLHKMTQIQRIISKINKTLSIQIEVKLNIFILETKQYAQQSLMIDEFFSKLFRLFETKQEFQPDFIIPKYKTSIIDIGYQNLDQFISDSLNQIKKQQIVDELMLFKLKQFFVFLSYLLELICIEKVKTSGRNKKLQEQILFLNKLMNKYGIDLIGFLSEKKILSNNIKIINSLINNIMYLMYQINSAFYLIENRDMAVKEIVSERFFTYFMNNQQKFKFGMILNLSKLSLYTGCFEQAKTYISIANHLNSSPYIETYLDYLESLILIFDTGKEDFLFSMIEFQTNSIQMRYRKIIISLMRDFRGCLIKIIYEELSLIHMQMLIQIKSRIDELYLQLWSVYGEDYAIDCCISMAEIAKRLLKVISKTLSFQLNTSSQEDSSMETNMIRNLNMNILQLVKQLEIIDIKRWCSSALSQNNKIPKILLQILPSPQIQLEEKNSIKLKGQSGIQMNLQMILSNWKKSKQKIQVMIAYSTVDITNEIEIEKQQTIQELKSISEDTGSGSGIKYIYTNYKANFDLILMVPYFGEYQLRTKITLIWKGVEVIDKNSYFNFQIN